ncbi:MAG: hypothetical protein WD063_15900 [Pirellulales bacterium]
MKCPMSFLAMLTAVSLALGQQPRTAPPYQPAVPPPSVGVYGGGGGYGYYGGAGTTAAGSSMTGMANVISARGDAALSGSAAAVNMTQAQKQEIENRQQYTNTYFEMRETNRQAREAEAGPRPTAEQIARIAHETAPKPLSPGEVNEVTGKLNWPSALQLDVFAADRTKFEGLFGSYSQLGSLSYADQVKAREIINSMNAKLKAQARDLPPPDYVACKSFLKSLMYTTCKSQLS